jgi:prevent-host-death family protein
MTMKKYAAGDFKARCLAVMEEVCATREPVLITKRGRPVAKLVPPDISTDDFIGRLEGIVTVAGDIESPMESPETWKALR